MTVKTFNSLGLDVKIKVPETIAEAVTLFGEQIVLDSFIKNEVYRGNLTEFRELLCEKLEEVTGIARRTKVVDEEEVWDEREAEYLKRIAAEEGKDVTAYQAIADEVSETLVFDASKPERSSSPRSTKPSKTYLKTAQAALALPADQLERVLANLRTATGMAVEANEDSIAHAIKAKLDSDRKNALAALGV